MLKSDIYVALYEQLSELNPEFENLSDIEQKRVIAAAQLSYTISNDELSDDTTDYLEIALEFLVEGLPEGMAEIISKLDYGS